MIDLSWLSLLKEKRYKSWIKENNCDIKRVKQRVDRKLIEDAQK